MVFAFCFCSVFLLGASFFLGGILLTWYNSNPQIDSKSSQKHLQRFPSLSQESCTFLLIKKSDVCILNSKQCDEELWRLIVRWCCSQTIQQVFPVMVKHFEERTTSYKLFSTSWERTTLVSIFRSDAGSAGNYFWFPHSPDPPSPPSTPGLNP